MRHVACVIDSYWRDGGQSHEKAILSHQRSGADLHRGVRRRPDHKSALAQTAVDNPAEAATQPDPGTKMRLAAMDTSAAAFRKLDADNDGRISAIEAADNPRVAAAFTMADKDKDGYLSKEEFEAMNPSASH